MAEEMKQTERPSTATADEAKPGEKRRGRPVVWNAYRRDLLCGLVRMGLTRRKAAKHIGVSQATVYRLLKEDPDFAEQLRQAEVEQEIMPLRYLFDHGRRSWRAAAWVLERTKPNVYGRRAAETVTYGDLYAVVTAILELALKDVDNAKLKQAIDRLKELETAVTPRWRTSPAVRKALKELVKEESAAARGGGCEVKE